jgi:predicted Zn-dependent protease
MAGPHSDGIGKNFPPLEPPVPSGTNNEPKFRTLPPNPILLSNLGMAYEHDNQLEKALRIYMSLKREDPDAPQPRILLASVYLQMGRLPKARSLLESVIKLEPRNEKALTLMTEVYHRSGDEKSARQIQQRLHYISNGSF